MTNLSTLIVPTAGSTGHDTPFFIDAFYKEGEYKLLYSVVANSADDFFLAQTIEMVAKCIKNIYLITDVKELRESKEILLVIDINKYHQFIINALDDKFNRNFTTGELIELGAVLNHFKVINMRLLDGIIPKIITLSAMYRAMDLRQSAAIEETQAMIREAFKTSKK